MKDGDMVAIPFNAEVTITYWYEFDLPDGRTCRVTTNYDADPGTLQVKITGARRIEPPSVQPQRIAPVRD